MQSTFSLNQLSSLRAMGSIQGLELVETELMEHVLPYLDEADGEALAEAVLAPKPKPKPPPKPILSLGNWCLMDNGTLVSSRLMMQKFI